MNEQATTETTETQTNPQDDWISPEIKEAMEFDPFLPQEESEVPQEARAENTEEKEVIEKSQEEDKEQATSQDDKQQEAAAETPEPQKETQILEQIDQKLEALTAPQEQQEENPADDVNLLVQPPAYDFNIPDELINLLGSEDPVERKTALTNLAKGVAQGVHQTLGAVVNSYVEKVSEYIPQAIEQYNIQQRAMEDVRKDFYGKYPQLDKPELRQYIYNVAPHVMNELGLTEWNEQARDAIADRVFSTLGIPKEQTKQAQQTPPPAKAPAMFGGSGTNQAERSMSAKSKASTQADFIAELFN